MTVPAESDFRDEYRRDGENDKQLATDMTRTQSQSQSRAASDASQASLRTGLRQRKCSCGTHTIGGGACNECAKYRQTLRRASRNSELGTQTANGVPPIVNDVLRSPGQPLDAATRAFFEPRFGQDFSRVRVHTDAAAAESAQAVNALAYTVGNQIAFGSGRYAPESLEGRKLLAHELTHVVQQSGRSAPPLGQSGLSDPGDATEVEAAETAELVIAGKQTRIGQRGSPGQLQRQQPPAVPSGHPCPTSVSLGSVRQYNHGNISSDRKERYRTYLSNIATMLVGPGPDHTGHCMQEALTSVSNSCPAALTTASAPCSAHDCLPITGTSFVDGHVTHSAQSYLEGTGVNSCSVVCEQRYYCDTLAGLLASGTFRITRNYQAGTYTRTDGSTVHITTGTVDKTAAPQAPAPSPAPAPAPAPSPGRRPEYQDAPTRTLPKGMEYA